MAGSDLARQLLAANAAYAAGYPPAQGQLGKVPKRQAAILTCMDARIEPMRMTGMQIGDAHVIRSAGGRARHEPIKSLVLSHHLLGTTEWFVIHHTDCASVALDDEKFDELLNQLANNARLQNSNEDNYQLVPSSTNPMALTATIVADVRTIRAHPLVPRLVRVHGMALDLRTGLLHEIPEATAAGQPI